MGYDLDLFTHPPPSDIHDEFLCPICHDVLQDVTMAHPCEHVFCRACIDEWRKHSKQCPVDRCRVSRFKRPQRVYLNLLYSLELRCPYAEAGCKVSLKLGDLPQHEARCEFNPETTSEPKLTQEDPNQQDTGSGLLILASQTPIYVHKTKISCTLRRNISRTFYRDIMTAVKAELHQPTPSPSPTWPTTAVECDHLADRIRQALDLRCATWAVIVGSVTNINNIHVHDELLEVFAESAVIRIDLHVRVGDQCLKIVIWRDSSTHPKWVGGRVPPAPAPAPSAAESIS